MTFYRVVKKLVADTCGSTEIKYVLATAVASIALAVMVVQLGGDLADGFDSVTRKVYGTISGW